MATDNFWGRFRRWRRVRPFWGGLLLMVSSVELFLSANMSVAGMDIHLGPQGFLSYLLPIVLLMCALASWFSPAQRIFYGVVALLAALYSFIGLNLGGFFVGMLLGILGGALVISWGPPRVAPDAGLIDRPTDDEPTDHDDESDDQHPADIDATQQIDIADINATQQIDIAGHDDRPGAEKAHPRSFVPGFPGEEPPAKPSRTGQNPKLLIILLIPLAVTATLLVAGSRIPASADEECPAGLPSRSYDTTGSASPSVTSSADAYSAERKKAIAKKSSAAAIRKAAPEVGTTGKTAIPAQPPASTPPISASRAAAAQDSTGDVIVGGVGRLLGPGDEESPSPSASPSPSEPPAQPAPASPSASASVPAPAPTSASASAEPTGTTAPSASTPPAPATSSASVLPTASGDVIPCLGPRVIGKVADPDGIPRVANKPGLMEVKSLTLFDSTYDGVVNMPTTQGGYKALKFSMRKATNTPFSLTIDEANGSTTKVTSSNLVTEGTVKFYTSELKGMLFGLIPVTFTPESPPPLTLPVLSFTDVKIKLAYVRCDTLTGDPLKIATIK